MASVEKDRSSAATEDAAYEAPYPKESYAWFVVIILMLVYVFSFIDRQILGLLVEPIKRDMGISDTQMGVLMGFSFAVFYTFLGLPMGRLADSHSRRGIIALGLIAWSFMSTGCGIAKNYWQLLFFRVGVGVGEATLSPSAYSLLTDYFRPNRVGLAISLYGVGIYMGSGLAFLFGAYVVGFATEQGVVTWPVIGDIRPWQQVFFFIGLPGIAFAAMLFLVKEPVRRGLARAGAVAPKSIALGEVWAYIWQNKATFLCHAAGVGFISFASYGGASWVPTFLVRVHGYTPAEAGKAFGWAIMLLGSAGILSGGVVAGWLANRGVRNAKVLICLFVAVVHLPIGLYPLIPNVNVGFAVLCMSVFLLAMPFGIAPAAVQEFMPNRMRGQASALYLLIQNMIGLGLGPTAVGIFTDHLFGDVAKVGWSLALAGTIASVCGAALLFIASKNFTKSLDRYTAYQAGHA